MANRVKTVLEMIKFEHSVFALPFALTGALLAARATHQPPRGWPSLRQILWIVVAMVAARSAAMTMNRIADLRYDRENPRAVSCADFRDRNEDRRCGSWSSLRSAPPPSRRRSTKFGVAKASPLAADVWRARPAARPSVQTAMQIRSART